MSSFECKWICGNTLNFSSCSVFKRFQIACLEIQYLLRFWFVDHACHLVFCTNLVDHHGRLLVQNKALVDL
jgi:hypothetical protein